MTQEDYTKRDWERDRDDLIEGYMQLQARKEGTTPDSQDWVNSVAVLQNIIDYWDKYDY